MYPVGGSAGELGVVEATAAALGRLDTTMRDAPESLRVAATVRFALAVADEADPGRLLVPNPRFAATPAVRYHDALRLMSSDDGGNEAERIASLFADLDPDGSPPGSPGAFADALAKVLAGPLAAASGVAAAALAAGAIIAPAASSRTAVRAGSLAAAAILVGRGLIGGPWVTTVRLDAHSRSAAVQLDRSGTSGPWIEAFCRALIREADAVRSAVKAVIGAFEAERRRVRAGRRTGATDEAVLACLQAEPRLLIADASRVLGLTVPTIGSAIARLEAAGLAVEITGRRRDRVWVASGVYAFAAGE
jgi:hypothetical protein